MARSNLLDFTKVRAAVSFADVLAALQISPAKPGQRQVKINCPFHEDSTPSCSINLEKGIFNCFGCPAEGNVLDFIQQHEEVGAYEAATIALEMIGRDKADFLKDGNADPDKPSRKKWRDRQNGDEKGAQTPYKRRRASSKGKAAQTSSAASETAEDTPEAPGDAAETDTSANPVKDIKLTLEPGHPFLETRNVSPALAEQFGMGFCNKGIMKNRIAIPLHNAGGEPIGFVGRWALDTDPPDGEAKYKLPKDFKKSLELFNLHRAVALMHDQGKPYVVVVEGIWSVTRLHAAGVPVVALMGTSLCDTQAQLIADAGFRKAMVILDGDDAGRQAAPDVVYALSQHVPVKTLVLPDGVKPDTMDASIVARLAGNV